MKTRRSAMMPSCSRRSATELPPSPFGDGEDGRGGERARLVELDFDPIEDARPEARQQEDKGHKPVEHPQERMRDRARARPSRAAAPAPASARAPRRGCAAAAAEAPGGPGAKPSSLSLAVNAGSLVKDMAEKPRRRRCQPLAVEIWRKGGSLRRLTRCSAAGSARRWSRQIRRNSTAPYRWSGAAPGAARGRSPSQPKGCRD